MINIAKSSGIVTVSDSSYSSLPIVKFVTVQSMEVTAKASGFFNGHYYWQFDGLYQGYDNTYIYFQGGDWRWTSALGGGTFIDRIQSALNTIYPLGSWLDGTMTSSTLITPASNLPKSYFNPTCNYTASDNKNIVYFKINGDSYEIPLASLEVDGAIPSALNDALDLITALLTSQ